MASEDYEIGYSMGMFDTYREAVKARGAGELDLWFAYNRPKTIEEWTAWEAGHGADFADRWKEHT